MKGIFFLIPLCFNAIIMAQVDSTKMMEIKEVEFIKKLPISKDIIHVDRDLSSKNLSQDLPILLKNQVSVLSSSDAGNGVGYTDFRIRGILGNSINVMLNGVPYNDSESHGTFFVNVSDLASSSSQIIMQRGVGTSSNGVASFGASVNILTKDPKDYFYLATSHSYGSFDTRRNAFELGTGSFWDNKISLMARYSITKSDGYIERAFSNLESYNITSLYKTESTKIKLMIFGGKEKTYQSWNGIDLEKYWINRKYNYSGEIYDSYGNVSFYDNETDNYRQNHFHLIINKKISEKWSLESTAHYTKGKGFYENYKQDESPLKYNIIDAYTGNTDFIRKKNLDNDFYGLVYNLYGNIQNFNLHIGGAVNQYYGRHYGNVNSILGLYNDFYKDYEYYRNHYTKNDFSHFAKIIYGIGGVELFGDIQYRYIHHFANIIRKGDNEGGNFSRVFNFINPKVGINFNLSQGKAYLSYALANREPNREDILSKQDIKHEILHDLELGVEKSWNNFSYFINLYYMYYRNQLVFSGKIDNVGAFMRENSGKSYRSGVEIGVLWKIAKNIKLNSNINFSKNKNINFHTEEKGLIRNIGNTKIALSPEIINNISLAFSPKKFNFSIQYQHVGKQYLDNTENTDLYIPNYTILDFLASYRLHLGIYSLDINFNLNNIFNKMYTNKGYVYDSMPYYFPQAGRNFMLGFNFMIK